MEVIWASKVDMSEVISVFMIQHRLHTEELDDNLESKLKESFSDPTFKSTVTRGAVQTGMLSYYDEIIKVGDELIKEIDKVIND